MNIISLVTKLTDTQEIMLKSFNYSNILYDDPSNFVLAISTVRPLLLSAKVIVGPVASLISSSRDLVPVMCIDAPLSSTQATRTTPLAPCKRQLD